jgi:hypothetical protein
MPPLRHRNGFGGVILLAPCGRGPPYWYSVRRARCRQDRRNAVFSSRRMGRERILGLQYTVAFCDADVVCIEVAVPAGGFSALARDLTRLLGASASASDQVAIGRGDGRPVAYAIVRPEGFRAILAEAPTGDGPARLMIARPDAADVWVRAKAAPAGRLSELLAGLVGAEQAVRRNLGPGTGRGRH